MFRNTVQKYENTVKTLILLNKHTSYHCIGSSFIRITKLLFWFEFIRLYELFGLTSYVMKPIYVKCQKFASRSFFNIDLKIMVNITKMTPLAKTYQRSDLSFIVLFL